MTIEKTLVLLKPDAVQRSLIGEIISRFERIGLKIIAMKLIWVDSEHSKKHYDAHVSKPFYWFLEEMITEGPIVAMVLEGIHAVGLVRKIIGPTEPYTAPPGTIRGDYAHVSYQYADNNKKAIKNLVHASGTIEEAEKEVALWFKEEELQDYSVVHEKHTR